MSITTGMTAYDHYADYDHRCTTLGDDCCADCGRVVCIEWLDDDICPSCRADAFGDADEEMA